MKLTTMWCWDPEEPDNAPRMLAAYDEHTADDWTGAPDFYVEDIDKGIWSPTCVTREVVIEIPFEPIDAAFRERLQVEGAVRPLRGKRERATGDDPLHVDRDRHPLPRPRGRPWLTHPPQSRVRRIPIRLPHRWSGR